VPAWDPTCSVSDCSRPTDGVLTIVTPHGSLRFSACEEHGQRARNGEWFTHTLLGCKYVLGPNTVGLPPAHYEPLRP